MRVAGDIVEVDHRQADIAAGLAVLQRLAYRVEADLIGFDGIPGLTVTAAEVAARSGVRWLAFVHGDEIIGGLCEERTGLVCDIDTLVVDPRYFRRGVGRALVARSIADSEIERWTVGTAAANVPARSLYESFGFAVDTFDDSQVPYVRLVLDRLEAVERPIEMVVLDAMGVIYEHGDDVEDLLVPFVRAGGCTFDRVHIVGLYEAASLGEITAGSFWKILGIAGEPDDIDRQLLLGHRLNPGAGHFLRWAAEVHMPVAVLSNDVSEWSAALRRLHGIEHLANPWVISGDVGVRKPDDGIYEAFADQVTVPLQRTLFVDDRLRNLEAAARHGMQIELFTSFDTVKSRVARHARLEA
jgi:ribosomal protein S18 acetylase RimI-like enzyme